ncbi:hypothetical protein B0H14DRAFT_2619051 [Mycena olivaceomarginata]|nr:hypothetical protein B0H14DRAFT_2619051 [Mycena olivaceomarginata]
MDPRDGSHTTRCTASSLQEAIMEGFVQEPGRRYAAHVEDAPRVGPSARDRGMAGRRISIGNFEDMEEHISVLLSRMQELESTVTQDVNDLATWCWDGVGGLWNETSGFQDELGDVRDELRSIQTRLKNLDMRSVELLESVKLAITDVRATVGVLEQSMRDREESYFRAHNKVICSGIENGECLREEVLDERRVGENGLIQGQLQSARMCEAEVHNNSPAAKGVEAFLLNWMKEERWVERGKKDEAKRKEQLFKPLLAKKQKAAIERAERQCQLGPLKFRGRETEGRWTQKTSTKCCESGNTNGEAGGLDIDECPESD